MASLLAYGFAVVGLRRQMMRVFWHFFEVLWHGVDRAVSFQSTTDWVRKIYGGCTIRTEHAMDSSLVLNAMLHKILLPNFLDLDIAT